jgi:hypothetical protein
LLRLRGEQAYDFASAFAPLPRGLGQGSPTVKGAPAQLGPVAAAFANLKVEGLDEGLAREAPLVALTDVTAVCPWLKEALDTGGKTFDEPLWRMTTLCATFMEDGQETAHKFACGHADYSRATTDKKWDIVTDQREQNPSIGFPKCATIDGLRSGACASCPNLAAASSPLSLALRREKPRLEIIKEVAKELGAQEAPELFLPDEYCLDPEGYIAKIVTVKRGKAYVDSLKRLFLTKITDPMLSKEGEDLFIEFTAELDKGSQKRIKLGPGQCAGMGLFTELNKQSCIYVNENTDAIAGFPMSWMRKLKDAEEALRAGTFGWYRKTSSEEITGFVYGGKIISSDGTTRDAGFSDPKIQVNYRPIGSKETWMRAAKHVTDQKRVDLNLILAAAFAAPLMEFAGEDGGMISGCGPAGTTKSSASKVAAAVWGHPRKTRESDGSTNNGVINRVGKTKVLPIWWDDVKDAKAQDHLFTTGFCLTQGVEKTRMWGDGTERDRGIWRTLLVATSNMSFVDYVVKAMPHTDAGVRRVFEYDIPKMPERLGDNLDASTTIAALDFNYGMVGMEFARILATEHLEVRDKVRETLSAFTKKVTAAPPENIWSCLAATLVVGAQYAVRLGIDIDVAELETFVEQVFYKNRRRMAAEGLEGGSQMATENLLFQFINEKVGMGHSVTTDTVLGHGGARAISILKHPLTGRVLCVQFRTDESKLRFHVQAFKDFLADKKILSTFVLNGVIAHFKGEKIKATLGAGTPYALLQGALIEIPITPDSPFLDMMLAQGGKHESQG